MSEELRIVLVSALPAVPAYFLGFYWFRFLLVPRSKRRHALFALYCLVLLTVKPIVDIYWQYTGQGRSAAMVLGLVMVPSLPVMLLVCFGGDWRRRLFVIFPFVCVQSVCIMPSMLYLFGGGWPVPALRQVLLLGNAVIACAVSGLVTDRLARLVEKLSDPVYTALAVASPVLNTLFNLEQALAALRTETRMGMSWSMVWPGMSEGLAVAAVFFWLSRRQARQTLAIAAARDAMHQRAVETQQRNLAALRALRRDHRQNLERVQQLLDAGQKEQALDMVRELTRYTAPAARRYADNPVADVSLADAARRCAEAGVKLTVQGSLPRDCTLPPVDLASLLYNLLSNAVTAAAGGPQPGWVSARFVTAAGRLCLTVENSTAAHPVRRRGAGHGFGQKILREITARYDGSYTLTVENGRARAVAMVCLPGRKEECTGDGNI